MKIEGNYNILIVVLYIDDLLYTNNNEKMIADFKKNMMKRYDMNDMDQLHYFLSMEIYQYDDGIFICQKKFIKNIFVKFGMVDCKHVATLLVVNEKLVKEDVRRKLIILYRSLVGILFYIIATRPNIMLTSSLLSRLMYNSSQ